METKYAPGLGRHPYLFTVRQIKDGLPIALIGIIQHHEMRGVIICVRWVNDWFFLPADQIGLGAQQVFKHQPEGLDHFERHARQLRMLLPVPDKTMDELRHIIGPCGTVLIICIGVKIPGEFDVEQNALNAVNQFPIDQPVMDPVECRHACPSIPIPKA